MHILFGLISIWPKSSCAPVNKVKIIVSFHYSSKLRNGTESVVDCHLTRSGVMTVFEVMLTWRESGEVEACVWQLFLCFFA